MEGISSGGCPMLARQFLAVLLVLGGILVIPQLPAAAADDAAVDVKALAGKWQPKEASLGDNKIDQLVLDTVTLVYEGDKYTLTIGDKVEKGTYKLDPQKTPKAMDIFPTEGDNNGKTFLAVYQVEGDKLTICYSISPGVRPEDFEANSNTLIVVKYERVKE
jgi:RNA polymerase sigma-70 factor (ECF subfamily)